VALNLAGSYLIIFPKLIMPMMRELIKIFGGRVSGKKNQSNDDINIFSTNFPKRKKWSKLKLIKA
jgi:hypothetical protein